MSVKGSFSTAPKFETGQSVVQDLVVSMLDKGTTKRSKIELATLLEDCGASIRFNSAGPRIRWEVKCLKPDLDRVLDLVNEQLRFPLFDETEFSQLKARILAQIKRLESDTGSRANDFLARTIFQPSHPLFTFNGAKTAELVRKTTVDDLNLFWRTQFGVQNLIVSAVGDLADTYPESLLSILMEGLEEVELEHGEFGMMESLLKSDRNHIEIPDRMNLDVKMGHGVRLVKTDPDFLPLTVGVFLLGGNFSSHLMSTIRDRDGFTYGIRSGLSGITRDHSGAWITSVTLSQDKLEEGIRATEKEMATFLTSKTTQAGLDACKSTLIGSYQINLSTTGGIASSLISNAESGFPLGRIDSYPEEIERLKEDQIDRVMSHHLHLDQLHVVSAGTELH